MKKTHGTGIRFLILALLFALVFFGSFWVGRYDVSPLQTLRILADWLLRTLSRGRLVLTQTWQAREQAVVLNVRLPRVAAAALVGAALSTAGCAYQGMFRNPMVSPDLLGASTGAGFGAALALLLGLGYGAVTGLSFTFGLLAVLLAYLISRVSKIQTTLAMVLAGVMISSLFTSGTSFIKLVADPTDQLPAITYWLMGSLTATKARDRAVCSRPGRFLRGMVPLWLLRWRVNLLTRRVRQEAQKSWACIRRRLRVVDGSVRNAHDGGKCRRQRYDRLGGPCDPAFRAHDFRAGLPEAASSRPRCLLGAVFLMVV